MEFPCGVLVILNFGVREFVGFLNSNHGRCAFLGNDGAKRDYLLGGAKRDYLLGIALTCSSLKSLISLFYFPP